MLGSQAVAMWNAGDLNLSSCFLLSLVLKTAISMVPPIHTPLWNRLLLNFSERSCSSSDRSYTQYSCFILWVAGLHTCAIEDGFIWSSTEKVFWLPKTEDSNFTTVSTTEYINFSTTQSTQSTTKDLSGLCTKFLILLKTTITQEITG